ncbi:MAG: molybdopterin-dependent oxidoreductase [Bacteroidetes bacterium]|nr:molybdopterin-dependent oxidoreductase [Bacteroidota bacterium]MBT5528858.1 molybdopterin-dependent oxidoreductase [Cytophagia bacterium]MBT3802548.1 molybdopterin-dependent oxidoreductase [Bacteroidota bacterium]MBT3933126.1 molybdopterin-dependent oxidoreductase [Bacteroidota bacterium]MBT5992080.1 molybdopterin-dependent oxidoreductase [Bacteroidota bacterium]
MKVANLKPYKANKTALLIDFMQLCKEYLSKVSIILKNKFSTACPRNCYSTCSFYVIVEDGKVVNIEPHPANKATPEGVCIKGLGYVERANSPDRLLHPLLKNKTTGKFEKISWEEVYSLLVEKLNYFKNKYGNHSIFFLTGSGMSGMLNDVSSNFWKLFGGCTRQYGNLCWPAGLEAVRLTLGENKHNAPWDLEQAKLIIFWGKNPAETNVQQMIFVEKAQEKGAKVIVIDPRKTQSAERSDLLIQPKPGTDAALALCIANILIENGWIDHEFIEKHVRGFEDFKTHVQTFTLEKTVEITGVKEDFILKLAEEIGTTKPMTIAPGYGMQRFSNGGQTIRTILALQIITGNIGKSGANFHYANLQSYVFDDLKEPLSYYPDAENDKPFRRVINMTSLGEDMLKTTDPELKMLWVERGNPVAQNPDTNTVLEAIRKMEFTVVIDQFMTDTAIEADLVLPAKNMFEQSDIIGSYWNPYIQLKQKVTEPPADVKPETEIYWELAYKLGFDKVLIEANIPSPTDESIDNWLKNILKKHPEINWEKLKQGPQLANGHEEVAFADLEFKTPSGKIELYSIEAVKMWGINPLADYTETVENESNSEFPLQLLTPNTKNRIHSQFGNLKSIAQFDEKPFVAINPYDAQERNITKGDLVKVFNNRGSLEIEARFDFGLRLGCVAIYNGWWLQEGGTPNLLSKGRETDMGHGAAFHDCMLEVGKIGS